MPSVAAGDDDVAAAARALEAHRRSLGLHIRERLSRQSQIKQDAFDDGGTACTGSIACDDASTRLQVQRLSKRLGA
jgi:hypothetical protein